MAEKTVVVMFDDFADAVRAVHDLEKAGFQHKDIGLIANNAENRHGEYLAGSGRGAQISENAGTGALAGSVAGGGIGLLAALGVLTIPGIGPVLAAGPVIAALTGAGIGAAAGGGVGGLIGLGVPEDDAHVYAEGVRRGGALVTLTLPEDRVDAAMAIVQHHGAVDLQQRRTSWRASGWRRFDERDEPWTVSRIDEDRTRRHTSAVAEPGSNDTGRDVTELSEADLARVGPTIRREAATARLEGGPQPSAMSGMFGSVENEAPKDSDRAAAGDKPTKSKP